MTPERLAEIALDIESYEKHQRYGPHELPYRTIERLECDDFPKYVRELLDHITALEAEIAELKAKKRKVFCLYCDLEFVYDAADQAGRSDLFKRMADHDATCSKNPLVAEIAKAKELIGILEDDQARHEEIIEELTRQCKCPECGCATVEDAESTECGCDAPVCVMDASTTLAEAYCASLNNVTALESRLAAITKAGEAYIDHVQTTRSIIANGMPLIDVQVQDWNKLGNDLQDALAALLKGEK